MRSGGSQIGLLGDEPDRHQEQYCGHREVLDAQSRLVAVEVPGEHEGHRDLHELGRLDAGDAEVQPALGAVHDLAEQIDRHQQDDADDVGRKRRSS